MVRFFEFSEVGLDKIKAKVKKISLLRIANYIKAGVVENYDKRRNFDGSAMTVLRPLTIILKRQLGSSTPSMPLIRTGQLRMANEVRKIGADEYWVSVRDKIRTGNTSNIQILQRQKLRGRYPFGFTEEASKKIKDYVEEVAKSN